MHFTRAERRHQVRSFSLLALTNLFSMAFLATQESGLPRVLLLGLGVSAAWSFLALSHKRMEVRYERWTSSALAFTLPIGAAVMLSLDSHLGGTLVHALWASPLAVALIFPRAPVVTLLCSLGVLVSGLWVMPTLTGQPVTGLAQWLAFFLCSSALSWASAVSSRRHHSEKYNKIRGVQAAASERARQQSAVAELGQQALSAESLESMARQLVCRLADTLYIDGCAVFVLQEGIPAELASLVRTDDANWYQQAIPDILAKFADAEQGASAADLTVGGRRLALVPIPSREGPAGILVSWTSHQETIGQDAPEFLKSLATTFGAFMAAHRAAVVDAERDRLLQAVFQSASEAIVILDEQGRFVDANLSASTLFEQPAEALAGKSLVSFITAQDRPTALERWKDFLRSRQQKGELGIQCALTATQKCVEYAEVAEVLPGRHLAILRDLTEHRAMQNQLIVADRMVSVGTLAAGVAHEINNPLAFVRANLEFVLQQFQTQSADPQQGMAESDRVEVLNALKEARGGTERIRVIVGDMKSFSRHTDEMNEPVDLHEVVRSCMSIATHELKHRAKVELLLDGVPTVFGNAGRLGQVFLNLIINAAQAVPKGQFDKHRVTVATCTLPDGRAEVRVSDTGDGISRDNLSRIFDPFFTTKPAGAGTGLGLSICLSIVQAHGGQISVESEPGKGSTFRVVLPAASAAPADPVLSAAQSATLPLLRSRLLVVDDEPTIGAAIRRAFAAEHDVTVLGSAVQALETLARGAGYDLILCDLNMPQMTGMELYQSLLAVRPELASRFIFLTGGSFSQESESFLAGCAAPCVEKPFSVDALKSLIAQRMARTPPPA